ncbi:MAG TPA: hypothetical protein VFH73_07760 [Polyangia bacterium]|jgi:hypothetical protein|nr:hypothetical protein [Polyangia bacterium]
MRFIWAILVIAGCSAAKPAGAPPTGTGGAGAAGGAGGTTDAGMSNQGGGGGASIPPPDATDLAVGDDARAGSGGANGEMGDGRGDSTDATGLIGSCTGAIACDDFEGNAAAGPPSMWTVDIRPAGTGTLQVDTTRAYSGTKSVHITLVANRDHINSFITRPLSALPNNTFYGRMMMWVMATPARDVHWDNIRAQGFFPGTMTDGQYNYGGGPVPGVGNLFANYWTPSADCWKNSQTRLPLAKWNCIEWLYDGTKNEMHYWLNGEEIAELAVPQKGDGCIQGAGANNWRAPPFTKLSLGWYNAQPSPIPIDMWMDDVGIDTKRIGCPPPP